MPSFAAYQEYPCSRNAPLGCTQPQQTVQQVPGAKFCLECGFPTTLPPEAEVRGSRGTYQVRGFLGARGMGRLYSGIQLNDNQPVVIKEYLLPPRCFNATETHQRKETFTRVAGLSSVEGRTQAFRLLTPWEAITDQHGERCYLIMQGNLAASETLSRHLLEKGAMTASQVREVLNQVLQTLQFLHSQKLRLPSGQIRLGLAHGNLSLDSLLISGTHPQFHIYICDLAAWERLFDSPLAQALNPLPEQDLKALGQVAFYLWMGHATPSFGQPLNLKDDQQWPDSDLYLKQFLHHLIGLDTPFESAEAARQALLQLPQDGQTDNTAVSISSQPTGKSPRIPLIIFSVLALLLVGGGLWYVLGLAPGTSEDEFDQFDKLLPQFADVNGIVPGEYLYKGEKVGTWSSLLRTKPESEQTLEELLTKPQPNVEAHFRYQSVASVADVRTVNANTASQPLKEVQQGKANFVITSLIDDLPDGLDSIPIAYDGLLVFVAFSKKDQNLPQALNGRISLEQLRQLYTGKITNWQELGGPDLPVTLHAPTEPEAIRQFEQHVLNDDPQEISLFQANVTTLATTETQRQIRSRFDEGKEGIIGFGILGKTSNQCSGYPLALVDGNQPASQALIQSNGQPIDPTIDLCRKNNHLDVEAFETRTYPLGYPITVVYPKDNSQPPGGLKFAELLKTRQGQRLLRKAGLVPLQPVPNK